MLLTAPGGYYLETWEGLVRERQSESSGERVMDLERRYQCCENLVSACYERLPSEIPTDVVKRPGGAGPVAFDVVEYIRHSTSMLIRLGWSSDKFLEVRLGPVHPRRRRVSRSLGEMAREFLRER